VPKAWDELPNYKSNLVSQEYYGGDFYGVAEKIDYLKDLGVNGIYFTPFFPATSTHRYDATTFKKVDPLLGGDLALGNLIKKLHRNSIKIIGDLTTNHTGDQHQWFRAAVTNKASKYRKYYYFDKKLKLGYAAWWGVKSLPKLNFNSLPLRNDLFAGKNSIVKSWLRFGLDGWRIDVGNMSGKYLADDRQKEVSTGIRNSMKAENPKAWLVAENADWNLEDLSGESWQGSMNYEGFMRPLWAWLGNNKNLGIGFHGDPIAPPKFSGTQLVKSMQAFSSGVPWQSFINSMTLLDSHDTARFKTVVSENLNLHLVGLSLLLTYPGIPSLLAGDEIGLTGVTGEDSRRTMPWDNPEKWDWELHENVKKLIAIRKEHLALTIGGIRWIKVEADQIAFLRESANQGILVELWREGGEFNLLKELSDLARFAKGATVLFETKGEKPAPGSRVTLLY
jgi:alpha-glucosidase